MLFLVCSIIADTTIPKETAHEPDTNQVIQLFDSIQLNLGTFDKAHKFALEAISISEEINYERGILKAQSYIGRLFFMAGDVDSSFFFFETVLKRSKKIKDTEMMIAGYNNFGVVYLMIADYKSAIEYLEVGLHLSDSTKNMKMIADIANKLGACYEELGYYTKSVNVLIRALEVSREFGERQSEANILNNIGIIFQNLKNFEKAEYYYNQANEIFLELDNSQGLSDILNNLGDLYFLKNEFPDAIIYFEESLRYCEELEDDFSVALVLNNIGSCYVQIPEYKLAEDFLWKAISLADELGYYEIIASGYANLGRIKLALKNYQVAIEYASTSLNNAKEIGAISDEMVANELLYRSYYKLGRNKEAFDCLKQYQLLNDSLNITKQNNQIHEVEARYETEKQEQEIKILTREKKNGRITQNYLIGILLIGLMFLIVLIVLYLNIRKSKKLLTDQKIYYETLLENSEDYILVMDINSRIKYISPSYENKFKRKIEDGIGNLASEFIHPEDKESLMTTINEIIVDKRALTFEFRVMENDGNWLHMAAKGKNLLDDHRIQGLIINLWDISDRVKNLQALEKSENELKKANQTKDTVLSIVGHDLLGPIGTNKSFTDMIVKGSGSLTKNDIIKIATGLKPAIDSTYHLAENLLAWGRIQKDSIGNYPSINLLVELINDCFSIFETQAKIKSITLKFEGDKLIKAYYDVDQVTIVLRNLISNALKFSHKEGTVSVALSKEQGFAVVTVRDSGIGIPDENLKSILNDVSKQASRYGTEREKGTGIGLLIVKDFVKRNKGELRIKSTEGVGTSFSFTIPLSKGES